VYALFWCAWSALVLACALAGWVLGLATSALVRRVLRALPAGRGAGPSQTRFELPVASVHAGVDRLVEAIAGRMPGRPLRWIVRRAVRWALPSHLSDLLDYCSREKVSVVDDRVLAGWLRDQCAVWIGAAAGRSVRSVTDLVLLLLLLLGASVAGWQFR
jgi:hypothetical protein